MNLCQWMQVTGQVEWRRRMQLVLQQLHSSTLLTRSCSFTWCAILLLESPCSFVGPCLTFFTPSNANIYPTDPAISWEDATKGRRFPSWDKQMQQFSDIEAYPRPSTSLFPQGLFPKFLNLLAFAMMSVSCAWLPQCTEVGARRVS